MEMQRHRAILRVQLIGGPAWFPLDAIVCIQGPDEGVQTITVNCLDSQSDACFALGEPAADVAERWGELLAFYYQAE